MKTLEKHFFVWVVGSLACMTVNARADATSETRLLELAREHFKNDLRVAEVRMFRASANGDLADFHPAGIERIAGTNDDDTAHAELWSTNRVIRGCDWK